LAGLLALQVPLERFAAQAHDAAFLHVEDLVLPDAALVLLERLPVEDVVGLDVEVPLHPLGALVRVHEPLGGGAPEQDLLLLLGGRAAEGGDQARRERDLLHRLHAYFPFFPWTLKLDPFALHHFWYSLKLLKSWPVRDFRVSSTGLNSVFRRATCSARASSMTGPARPAPWNGSSGRISFSGRRSTSRSSLMSSGTELRSGISARPSTASLAISNGLSSTNSCIVRRLAGASSCFIAFTEAMRTSAILRSRFRATVARGVHELGIVLNFSAMVSAAAMRTDWTS